MFNPNKKTPWTKVLFPVRAVVCATPLFLLALLPGIARADFTVAYTSQIETRPSVAANPGARQFAAAWVENSGSTGYARACIFDSNGVALSPVIQPFGTWTVMSRPAIAFNSSRNEYLVVDATPGPDTDGIIGQRLDGTTGALVGDRISMFTTLSYRRFQDGGNPVGVGSIRIAYNSFLDEYLVTAQLYADPFNPSSASIWGEIISAGGVTVHPAFQINFWVTPEAHGTAHAPIATTPPGGRYLVTHANGTDLDARLIDADGNIIVNDLPLDDGNPDHDCGFSDVAYGRVEGMERFLVVWSDGNNCKPGISNCSGDWTLQQRGVWGTYVDPYRTVYNPPNTDNVAFPISNIPMHKPGYNYNVPKVAYNESAQSFFVSWVESPTNDPANSGEPTLCTHIRGDRVDSYSAGDSHPDVILSDVNCNCPPQPTGPMFCESDQNPRLPAVAAIGPWSAVVVWQQNYPYYPTDQDILGDLFGFTPPANDAFANAQIVDSPGGTFDCTLAGAANDGSATCGNSSGNPDIWYRFTAPYLGKLVVSTCGTHDRFGIDTGPDTVLSIHDAAGNQIDTAACNDDFPSGPEPTACATTDLGYTRDSALSRDMAHGQIYWMRVSRYGTSVGGACKFNLSFAGTGAGRVPVDSSWPGTPLLVNKAGAGNITLTWGASCKSGDTDYEIFEGRTDSYYSHTLLYCSTGGATSITFLPSSGNRYYLVVPQNGSFEGSYGKASGGAERPQGARYCLLQQIASCP
jgi:hypothetical protein